MNMKNIVAFHYYKKEKPDCMTFFRVNNHYEVYQADAVRIGKIFGIPIEHFTVNGNLGVKIQISDNKRFDLIRSLHNRGIKSQIIECRDNNNNFDVPDINRIKREKMDDY